LIHIWARFASKIPNIVNFLTQTPGLSALAKFAAGAEPSRKIPAFAPETFKQWFANRAPRNIGKPDIVLFPDTFNDHFHPDTARAAVEILEDAGFHVIVPRPDMCCGRPLYDYGMVPEAKRWLKNAIDVLKPYTEAGLSIVFLEPSCLAVFRDEMRLLLPADEDAKRLKDQTFPLSDFFATKVKDFEFPKLNRKVMLQIHCHHKSVYSQDDQQKLFKKLNAEVEMPEPGCCGMAGAFGFEEGRHYDVSEKIGEQRLLPAVRNASDSQLIVADGFSCREQIQQGSNRQALHCAEALKLAKSNVDPNQPFPERVVKKPAQFQPTPTELAVAGAVATGALAIVSWLTLKQRRWNSPDELD
jgi:Fe-S oxidoreductase